MTHSDTGKYGDKHRGSEAPSSAVLEAVKKAAVEGTISCVGAFDVAGATGAEPAEVGRAIDLLEIRITRCQLGLFGHSPVKKIAVPADSVDEALEKAIRGSLAEGKLTCRGAWDIAEAKGISKLDVSKACEKLNIKISRCQLGTF